MQYGWEDNISLAHDAEKVADVLNLVGNQKRLEILCLLAGGPMCVKELEDALQLSQSAMSQHLAKLRAGNLVSYKKEAQTVYYYIENKELLSLMKALHKIYCSPKKINI